MIEYIIICVLIAQPRTMCGLLVTCHYKHSRRICNRATLSFTRVIRDYLPSSLGYTLTIVIVLNTTQGNTKSLQIILILRIQGFFYEPSCSATIRLLLRRTLVRSVRYSAPLFSGTMHFLTPVKHFIRCFVQ
jgi:hypothetical protein